MWMSSTGLRGYLAATKRSYHSDQQRFIQSRLYARSFGLSRKMSLLIFFAPAAATPQHRRRGVARRMLVKAEDGFRRRHVRIVRLEVRSVNTAAQDLYRQLGYAVTQRLPRYYSNGGDGLLMIKSLV